ncbi:MAG: ATP-binding protein [SAR324 cluster bacterium]|nr:ATP-binding protein [SAR324 cluster bacterium]
MDLAIRIYSFGYQRSGIPADSTENNGGFVFDCRCLPNPGRDEKYRSLTGLDTPVQAYLKRYAVVQIFAESCAILVQLSIDNYLERKFTNLMVSFGCTGGQHRSVYQAELLRMYLKTQEGISLQVVHTEQPQWPK